MARIDVNIAEELFAALERNGLDPSALLEEAIRSIVERQRLLAETDDYLRELFEEVGAPTPEDIAHVDAILAGLVEPPVPPGR